MSDLFVIEANWPTQSLKELCSDDDASIQTGPFGTQLHAADYVADGVPCVMPQDIRQGIISVENIARITPEDYVRLSRFKLREGDIIYPRRGDISKRALVGRREAGWLCGTGCLRIRPNTSKVDPRYLSYFLSHPAVCAWLEGNAVGATMPHLNTGLIGAVSIVCPPRSEQREIASTLGALDDKIELNRKMAATLEEMARALYRSWFVDFDPVRARAEGRAPAHMDAATAALFPDSFGEDGLPVGWKRNSYTDLIEILSGGTPKTSEPSFWGGPIPWYSVVDTPSSGQIFVHATEKNITEKGLENSPARIVPRGTTILSARGTVGKLAIASSDITFNQSCYGLRGRNKPLIAFTYFATLWAVNQLKSMAHGSVFSTITRRTFENIELPSVPTRILDVFEERTACWLNQIDRLGKESRTLSTLRDTLLPRLMSGELRVGAARELVEEVV